MEWVKILSVVLPCLVSSAAGLVGFILYYRENKAGKQIDNEAKRSEEWKKLFDTSQEDSRAKNEKIEKLYDDKRKMREENEKLLNIIADLKVENIKLKMYRCDRVKCLDREPPMFADGYNEDNNIK